MVMGGGLVTRYRPLFAPLGELTISFSLMEQSLDDALRVLENLSYQEAAGRAVDDDVKRKINRFYGAASREAAAVPELTGKLSPLVRDLHDARERRNRAQHGQWLGVDQTESVAKLGRRKEPSEWHDHTPDSLHNDALFCFDVRLRVDDWIADFRTKILIPRNTTPTA
jgi:hypothetical protein